MRTIRILLAASLVAAGLVFTGALPAPAATNVVAKSSFDDDTVATQSPIGRS